jgi:DNA polymerase I-like protein with 3'-5' exonuclease and polymerase domains
MLKYQIVALNQTIQGAAAEVLKNSVDGDSFVVSAGQSALLVKVKDLVEHVAELEKQKLEEANKEVEKQS